MRALHHLTAYIIAAFPRFLFMHFMQHVQQPISAHDFFLSPALVPKRTIRYIKSKFLVDGRSLNIPILQEKLQMNKKRPILFTSRHKSTNIFAIIIAVHHTQLIAVANTKRYSINVKMFSHKNNRYFPARRKNSADFSAQNQPDFY